MELVYRLATETSPLITQIRNNVIVSVTPAAEPDGRDRNVDWFYRGLDFGPATTTATTDTAGRGGAPGGAPIAGAPNGAPFGGNAGGQLPYWGKYVYHDNNHDINLADVDARDHRLVLHGPSTDHPRSAQAQPPSIPTAVVRRRIPTSIRCLRRASRFSNWELTDTKWGMPGVYTHAFMDGWSPGYLGSVAYNQRHDENVRNAIRRGQPRCGGGGGRGAGPVTQVRVVVADAVDGGGAGRVGRGIRRRSRSRTARRGGGQPRSGTQVGSAEWRAKLTRRNNTNYMETGAVRLNSRRCSNLILENFCMKTKLPSRPEATGPFGHSLRCSAT